MFEEDYVMRIIKEAVRGRVSAGSVASVYKGTDCIALLHN